MSWAHYLLQVNIYLVIFYCFYKLLLDKETYFVLNRIYLIAAGVLSLAIPFLRFEWFNREEVAQHISVSVGHLNNLVSQVAIVEDSAVKFNWGSFIVLVYLLGILFCTIKFVLQLLSVRKMLKTISNGMAFSFLHKKVISENLPEVATVTLHEDIHVKQLHTLDVLFFEFLGIVAWFNPIIYAYKNTIKNIHEFLADEAAAKFQGDKEAYAMLLLSQAFGIRPNALTNGFFTKSLIKKRIFMLHKQRSKKIAILKYGLFVPLFALTLVLSSATIRKNNKILAVAEIIPLNSAKDFVNQVINAPMSVVDMVAPPAPTSIALGDSAQTVIMGDPITGSTVQDHKAFEDFYQHIGSAIRYPSAAVDHHLQGNTIVNFTVSNGKILNVTTANGLGEGCDEMVINSIMGYENNSIKDGKYSIKVSFKLEDDDAPFKNAEITANDGSRELSGLTIVGYAKKEKFNNDRASIEAINALPGMTINNNNEIESTSSNFVPLSIPPTYPGGLDKLYDFINKSIKYPVSAADNEIQGSVLLSFIIEKDGTLSNFSVDKKLGYGIDEEALRVMKFSKRWLPGVQNGKTARVKYSLPIRFSLDSKPAVSKASIVASVRLKNFSEGANKQPLFIVDGELKENDAMNKLDPKKIANIDVVKSENAVSLYGKKAENGAVVITSKKPEKPRVSATIFK